MEVNKKIVSFFVLLVFFSFWMMPSKADVVMSDYNSLKNVSSIFTNKDVVSKLKGILGEDYDSFSQNFDVYGDPHMTSEGGLFVEGWSKDLYLEQASAFVIQPDGKAYAAWISPANSKINYRSNDISNKKTQEDIAVWAKRFKDSDIDSNGDSTKNDIRLFETEKFRIKIISLCKPKTRCDDVSYEGIRKSDGAVIKLTGKVTQGNCVNDVCKALSYKFRNHDATYIINAVINNLTVVVNNKVVLSEDGKWSNVNE